MLLFSRIILAFTFSVLLSHIICGQGTWKTSRAQAGGDLVAVYFTSAEKGWIAGDAGYLAWTSDGGRSWSRYVLNTTEDINEIYFRNDSNGYLVAGKKLFITSDGGSSWLDTTIYRASDFRNGTPEFLSIRFSDKKRGLIVGSVLNRKGDAVLDSLVMRTEDGGETWRRVIMPSKAELFHLDFNGSSHAWIVGDKGVILASVDYGATWRVQASGTERALFNVDFHNDDEGYAVGGKGTILRTDNGGAIWQKVATPFTDTLKRVDFADDKNGWIAGFGGSILSSSDKGKTWTKQKSGTTDNLYGLFMTKKYGWAVGASGLLIQYQK
ncbi:MAG: hypothetical protein H7070_12205 [Saprospiraceae bacterium]|nr:hypothetical protein [Pyrinomonadaceae bacterium]